MCPRKSLLLLLLLSLFVCDKVFATTFVVTSNADAGPNTLRQALLDAAADVTGTPKVINFMLPNATVADVTIVLNSQLPDVPGNTTIDGTSEPGAFLGVSNAKVIITPATPSAAISGLNISGGVTPLQTVAIYGLYIKGFSPNGASLGNGIVNNAPCALTIGAPGKGNVISGNALALDGNFQTAFIQSNFIGLEPDGETIFNNVAPLYSPDGYNFLVVGGASPSDGNVIIGGSQGGLNFGGGNSGLAESILIQNNFFNTDYKGTTAVGVAASSCILITDANTTAQITANVFSASAVGIAGANRPQMVITGNFFGTDLSQTYNLSAGTSAIENNGVDATIGGTTPADQNVFTNYQNPINCYNNSITDVIENIFYCNTEVQLNDPSGTNFIRITTLTNNSVGGDAPPGATVQLYYTDNLKCPASCNPYQYFATVTSNTAGKWQYTGSLPLNVLASSTVGGNTVGFQFDALTQDEVTITNYDCSTAAGSIVLNEPRTGNFQFSWTNSTGTFSSTSQNLANAPAGTYTLQLSENGGCPSVTSASFTIVNTTPKVFPSTQQLDCGTPTASFTTYPSVGPGITVATYNWTNSQGTPISSTNTVNNLTAGNYYLYITDSKGCTSNTAQFQVLPAVPTPVIDVSQAVEKDATCNLSNGSVTGVTVTNASGASYGWSTAGGTPFAPGQLNLTNAPPGQYYFYVYYDFNCPPVTSNTYTINESGVVTLDDSKEAATTATCNSGNGAISGITTTGATQFLWYNTLNPTQVVGSTLDISGIPAGQYYLVAASAYCSIKSQTYTVPGIPPSINFPSTYVEKDAFCDQPNGSITVTFAAGSTPAQYSWTDASGNPLAKNIALTGAAAGTYDLYVTDSNGCVSLYNTYMVGQTPPVIIDTTSVQATTDQCLQGKGGLSNVQISGGIPPYTYTWTNVSGGVVSSSLNVTDLVSGNYLLLVRDSTKCAVATQQFFVPNETGFVATPEVPDVEICNPGQVLIQIKEPLQGYGYRLYATEASIDTLQQGTSGLFNITVTQAGSFYVTQYLGDCESARVQVNVKIGVTNLVIPNTFTPNNDGINDFWAITGIENYPNALVQIFTRYGQKVFDSKGYAQPFNGNYNNAKLPPGVYYYIINLNSNCSFLSGSLALIR